jgi:methanogenic corrinoid protein MtbC1
MTIEAQRTAEAVAAQDATTPAVAVAHSPTWQTNLARLQELAEVLAGHGLRTRLMTPPGRVPSLHVVNPSASALAEDVYAGRAQDGRWWFWWSWAERIASGEDPEGAASMIEHVLAVTG